MPTHLAVSARADTPPMLLVMYALFDEVVEHYVCADLSTDLTDDLENVLAEICTPWPFPDTPTACDVASPILGDRVQSLRGAPLPTHEWERLLRPLAWGRYRSLLPMPLRALNLIASQMVWRLALTSCSTDIARRMGTVRPHIENVLTRAEISAPRHTVLETYDDV